MKIGKILNKTLVTSVLGVCYMGVAWADGHTVNVNITPGLKQVEILHQGRPAVIRRIQEKDHLVPAPYNKTARPCPPFCIQPMKIAVGVETVGELEVLGYLKRITEGDQSVLVIDSRTRDWVMRGTIPGSVNIPWNTINLDFVEGFDLGAASEEIDKTFEARFGARRTKTGWDFSNVKTLVLFCNGAWCPQSPTNVKTLLSRGYPPDKLKWYRGGMQSWVAFGLTVVTAK